MNLKIKENIRINYDLRNTTDFISAVLVFYLSFMNVALLRT